MADSDLLQRAEVLTRSVTDLSTSVTRLAANQARTRIMVWTLTFALVLLAVVTVAGVILYDNQRRIADQLTEQGARVEAVQGRTSNDVLCPLYKALLAFETRAVDPPNSTVAERQARQDAYAVIHRGYDVLDCH